MSDEPGKLSGRFVRGRSGVGTTGKRTLRNDPLTRVDGMIWSVPHSDGRPGLRLRLDSFKRKSARDEFEPKTQINLEDDQVEELFRYLVEERHLAGLDRTTDYVVIQLNRDEPDTDIVLRLLTYFQRDPKVFLKLASEIGQEDLSALFLASNLVRIQRTAKELEGLIDSELLEHAYQVWFEEHPWVFGSEYVARIPMRTIGLDSQADVLLRTADGFMDVFEIKRPNVDLLVFDKAHNTWKPSAELSEAFGQALKYLDTLSEQQLVLETRYGVTAYRPRVRIVGGRSLGWDEGRQRTVRAINAHWHGIEVLSYDMVLTRAKNVISHLVQGLA